MLVQLAIRNIVLIDHLDLAFGPGLTVLTGETGAGKSICSTRSRSRSAAAATDRWCAPARRRAR